jgi:8-oxo-dGTP pyrophosphatase MutT (NUDIX family)
MEPRMELLEELRSYRASDAAEAQHQRDILDLLSYGLEPFSRGQFVPGHVTASCFIVDPPAKRVLLHHHRRLGRWLQMGGHIEAGETARSAALREGAEESGLKDLELMTDGVFDIDVHTIPSANGEPDHVHFDVRYVARTMRPDSIIMSAAESNELAWAGLDEAEKMMNTPESSRAIMKIRKML